MAETSELYSELIKLKKEYLVDIIINKKVPHLIQVSENVRNHVENENKDAFYGTSEEITSPNLQGKPHLLQIRIDLEVANARLDASTKIQIEKERQIQSLYTIIELIKSQKSEELPKMNSGARTSKISENMKPKDVATSSSSSPRNGRSKTSSPPNKSTTFATSFSKGEQNKIEKTPKIK
ncbi:hypothetical protein WA026_008457 [Henosepilachna vigintioctopunctata]|uniref:Uncharacterized protein n=1 Tax=Henosepilachna vigintioctopunctata TaxID=420089 RepID=A0AAW1UIL2_9CUCU